MPDTPLAQAARRMLLDPSDAARLAFYEALSGAELTLPLGADAGQDVEPQTEDHDGVPHVIAHDRATDLGGADVASLSGLALATMLAGQGAGLALRHGAPRPLLIAPEALDWLSRSLADGPEATEARPLTLRPPAGLPESLLGALDRRIAQGEGLATEAWLAAVDWSDGTTGHLLAILGARPGAEETLAAGVHAAVALSGADTVRLDVTFLRPDDPVVARLARVGLRFDLAALGGPPRLK